MKLNGYLKLVAMKLVVIFFFAFVCVFLLIFPQVYNGSAYMQFNTLYLIKLGKH